jgi:hypothetical protein
MTNAAPRVAAWWDALPLRKQLSHRIYGSTYLAPRIFAGMHQGPPGPAVHMPFSFPRIGYVPLDDGLGRGQERT